MESIQKIRPLKDVPETWLAVRFSKLLVLLWGAQDFGIAGIKREYLAMTDVAQMEHCLSTKKLQVQFPVGAHTWVAGLDPQSRRVQEATQCFSLASIFLSFLSSLCKKHEKMSLGEDFKK